MPPWSSVNFRRAVQVPVAQRPGQQHHQRRRRGQRREQRDLTPGLATAPDRPVDDRHQRQRQRHRAHVRRQPHERAEAERGGERPPLAPRDQRPERQQDQRRRRHVGADHARQRHARRPQCVEQRRDDGGRAGAEQAVRGGVGSAVGVGVSVVRIRIREPRRDAEDRRRRQRPQHHADHLLRQQVAAQRRHAGKHEHEARHVDETVVERTELEQVVRRFAIGREVADRHGRHREHPQETSQKRQRHQGHAPAPAVGSTPPRSRPPRGAADFSVARSTGANIPEALPPVGGQFRLGATSIKWYLSRGS